MKKIIISLLLVVFIGFVFADNEGDKSTETTAVPLESVSLSGTVIDFDSGEALAGVEVKIQGTDIKAYTDFDGNFEFTKVKPGAYNLIASYISYKNSLVENYQAKEKENAVNIKLQPSK